MLIDKKNFNRIHGRGKKNILQPVCHLVHDGFAHEGSARCNSGQDHGGRGRRCRMRSGPVGIPKSGDASADVESASRESKGKVCKKATRKTQVSGKRRQPVRRGGESVHVFDGEGEAMEKGRGQVWGAGPGRRRRRRREERELVDEGSVGIKIWFERHAAQQAFPPCRLLVSTWSLLSGFAWFVISILSPSNFAKLLLRISNIKILET